jgi:C-terminal processing protease CtpA/Prc
MQAESANSRTIDWARLRTDVLAAAGASPQTIQDAYPAIELALRSLNDFESHYVSSTGSWIGPSLGGCTLSPAVLSSLPTTIGYVKVSGCPCPEGPGADAFAEQLQREIRAADRPGLRGWIVDLREDGGGNMWPMMAGLGPILGEGIMGWIVYNNREYEREYRGGAALSLDYPFARVAVPYMLIEPSPRVAVLTGGGTNSAGEAIVVWFKGRPDTRSFGTPTCGHHHLLNSFPLSDRATLTLKNANNADRLKRPYAGPIAPDEIIADPDELISRAVAWIQSAR